MKQLIYIIGAPGSGKSTLMRDLTARWDRAAAPGGLMREWLTDKLTGGVEAVELGRRRATFSGTDAMAQTVIGDAIDWMIAQSETRLVFGEGARLGVRRFLSCAAAAGYAVILVHLDHPDVERWREDRARRLGKIQNSTWVAGRATAARNLAGDPPDGVNVVTGHPDTLLWQVNEMYRERMTL